MNRWVQGILASVAVLIAVIVVAGAGAPVATSAAASTTGSLGAASTGALTSATWTPGALAAASTTLAPYTEPGYHLAGASYLGPINVATPANPTGAIPMLLGLQVTNSAALNLLLSNLQNPSSPQYHQYLTHAQFDQEFGGNAGAYNSLVAYLNAFGVTSVVTHPDRLSISFDATPGQIEQLFHVYLGSYVSASGQTFYAPTSLPSIPAPLAPYVTDLEGLSDYSMYLNHMDSASTIVSSEASIAKSALAEDATTNTAVTSTASSQVPLAGSSNSPGGSRNPFAATTVTSNGLTNTYDVPPLNNSQTNAAQGLTGSCGAALCGEQVPLSDLQVTYNETGIFKQYGYPVNASVAALLWTDTVCTANTGTCSTDSYYNYFCSTLTSGSYAWDFFGPDVTNYWNYTLPAGEPMPNAIPLGVAGGTYAYPTGSQGYSAACDSGGAEGENTLDVDAMGAMAPGANVFDVFADGSSTTTITSGFAALVSPSTSAFSSTGGYDTAANIQKMENLSAIDNSWTGSVTEATWATYTREANALGITVEGSTGDSGTTLAAPAELSFNSYGTVAVGGTTVVPNQASLQRTADHTAVMTAPYYGVGGGEIGWYQPSGTVDGFTSTYGSTGGVSSSTSYWRATWFNGSSDAVGVANAVRSGNYRAEPDVAAIANDTFIDYDQGPASLNITCLAVGVAHCAAVSPKAVGLTSGSTPTLGWTFFVGTSIAGQIYGGEITVVDHALYVAHQGKVGFADPAIYSQGQLEYNSQLTLHSFYDVSVYTGAGGLSANYEAKAGYDLATGWGALDVGNYTQNVMTFNATFTESGLPSGTQWSLTLTPTIGSAGCVVSGPTCSNSVTHMVTASSGSSSTIFAETYGAYTYSVTVSGYQANPSSGTALIHGAATGVSIQMNPTYTVDFRESGLPSGTWGVTFAGSTAHAAIGTDITFTAQNGTYPYNISAHAGYTASHWSGSVVVLGTPSIPTVTTNFTVTLWTTTFSETGLPGSTAWAITFNGVLYTTTASSFSIQKANGTYTYAIGVVGGSGYTASPSSGHVTLSTGSVTVPVTFSQVTQTYSLYFTESGLPSGTMWSVTVDGTNTLSASTSTITFSGLAAGTYTYTYGSVAGYTTPGGGGVTITSVSTSVGAVYSGTVYTVTFTESGLPGASLWGVAFGNTFYWSTSTSVTFQIPAGTYAWVAGAPGYYVSGQSSASPTMVSGTTSISLTFSVG